MKKRILSMILAIAMVISMVAGIAITASAAEGTYVLTEAIAVGDTLILARADGTKVFTGVSEANIGVAADAVPTGNTIVSAEAAALTVEAGCAEGTFAFKQADGTYLGWTSSNKLYAMEAIEEATSWTVSVVEGVMTIANVKDASRVLQYNATNPRFCAYTGSQAAVALYKLDNNVCTHADATGEVTAVATCTEAGSMTYTCSCGYTWTAAIPALGHSYNEGEVTTAATCTEEGVKTYTCTVCAATKTDVVPALGHNYVEDVCSVCGAAKAPTIHYVAIDLGTVAEGNYVIGAVRGDVYPTVYLATAKVANDWYVSDTAVTAENEAISSDNFAEDVQVFAFAGNNTDGFTIGYELDGVMQYLGVADAANNRKLAMSPDYATTLWTVVADPDGGYALSTPITDGNYVISQNSANTSALRGYKTGTIYTGIYLFAEADENAFCEHANTSEVPAVDATCTEAGNTAGVVCNDCGKTVSGNEVIPALGHTNEVSVVDGNVMITCTVCGASEAMVLNTIAEAKAYTDKTVVYNVKGVVTYVNGRTVYIEDANDGLCVYFPADFDTSALVLGDEIVVGSTMTAYKGLLELDGPTAYYVVSTGNALPNNTAVTVADLLADTENAYLGERVTISGLKVGTVNTSGATTLTDESGNNITLFKAVGMPENVSEGDTITVTAIVSTFNGYQLIVNPGTIATDIVVTNEGEAGVVETVEIAVAKNGTAGEYYQVEGVVTAMSADKRTIYIQDATGGIALYLNAKPAEAVCAIGDMVKGYGSWKVYNGLIELDNIDASNVEFFEILSSGNTVEAQLVEIVDLAVDLDNEYLAEKVRIEGATITEIATNGTVTLDQNGTTITIYKAPALSEECVVGAIVNVTAVVSAYNGYQLLINEAADVEYVGMPSEEPTVVDIKINHTLNLASDISINFAVAASLLADYDSFYLECEVPVYEGNTANGYKTVVVEPVLNVAYYYFTLTGVTAVQMNDMVNATLHLTKGTEKFVTNVDVYSVSTYAYSQLNKTNASAKLKALCADLLRYGSYAQIFKNYRTDALVDGAMTEEMIAMQSDINAVTFNNVKEEIAQIENPTVTIAGRSLSLDSKVTLNYVLNLANFTGNKENLTVHVTYTDVNNETKTVVLSDMLVYNEARQQYMFAFDALLAAELRTVLTAVVYEGETQVSNAYTYTIDTYGNGKSGALLDLCKALMAYSDTALAYFVG